MIVLPVLASPEPAPAAKVATAEPDSAGLTAVPHADQQHAPVVATNVAATDTTAQVEGLPAYQPYAGYAAAIGAEGPKS